VRNVLETSSVLKGQILLGLGQLLVWSEDLGAQGTQPVIQMHSHHSTLRTWAGSSSGLTPALESQLAWPVEHSL
jgi:hypothetical protein